MKQINQQADEEAVPERNEERGPRVEVVHLNTNEAVSFQMPWESTVNQVWERAYAELEEARGPGDEFQCQDGTSLMGQLNSTLEQLREQHTCQARKFAIRGPTGGAYGPGR